MNRNISKHLMLGGQMLDKERKYWMDKLSGELVSCHFPYDYTYPSDSLDRHKMEVYPFQVPVNLSDRLTRLSNNSNYNMFIVLLAVLVVLLNKYTGEQDIIIAVPMLNQNIEGEFLNTVLAIRTQLTEIIKFKELVVQVKELLNEANENVNYPLEELQHHLELPIAATDFSLFESAILLENIHKRQSLKDITPNILFSFNRSVKALEGTVEYNSLLYKKETVKIITRRFIDFLQQTMRSPGDQITGLTILSEKERREILEEFNSTTAVYPSKKSVARLFEKQVEKTPYHIAPVYEDHWLSYDDLNKKAGQLAQLLVKRGIKPKSIVGIMAEPSIERMIGMMAILKTGSAYLPIDSDFPAERMIYMLTDCQVDLLLTQHHLIHNVTFTGSIINLNDSTIFDTGDPGPIVTGTPTDAIYVIYTSGTSGKPKGVLIQNKSLVNYFTWFSNQARLTINDKTTLSSSFALDLGYTSIYSSLLSGGELHLFAKETYYDIEKFLDYIRGNRISYIKLTPSLFSLMVNNTSFSGETFKNLRLVVLGGEAINLADVEKLHIMCDHVEVMNHYGPTEATIGCIAKFLDYNRFEEYKRNPTIGKPINNNRAYIFDCNAALLPVGVPGELTVSGLGLARGYLNRPELTSEKFVNFTYTNSPTHPFIHSPIYRTGDRARWLPDGNIEFLGRLDQQVKIRGFRVEPAAIENQLLRHAAIKEAVVLAREDEKNIKYLCAYFVSNTQILISELREFLANFLPDYMIPSYFVPSEKIPLTFNGKVDKKALPEPGTGLSAGEYIEPRYEIEKKLVEIWSEILEIEKEKLGIEHNFFELGGHSLKAITLVSKISKELNAKVPMTELFERPTIRGLAEFIKETVQDRYASLDPVEKKEYYALSSAQKRLYFLQQFTGAPRDHSIQGEAPGMELNSTSYNIFFVFTFGRDIDINKFESTLKKLIERHESLRTSFIMAADEPVQKIHENVEFAIEYYDISKKVFSNCPPSTINSIIECFIRPFDLSQAPLIRSFMIQLPDDNHIWMVDMHHIISDGTSRGVLAEDFITIYSGQAIPELRLQYKDFSQWQNHLFERGEIKAQEDYWLGQYSDSKEIPRLQLLADYKRPAVFTFTGDYYEFWLEQEDVVKFRALGSRGGGTLYMNILAVLNTLFYKYTSQTDIIIGSSTAGRRHADLQRIIGMFVNTLAMRNHPTGYKTYEAFLNEVVTNSVKALENQDVQFEELVDKLNLERDPSRNPLFDISMVVQNLRQPGEAVPGGGNSGQAEVLPLPEKNLHTVEYKNTPSKFDMTFFIHESGDGVCINIEYYTGIFRKATIKRLALHFVNIIKTVIIEPSIKLKDIEIISEEEKNQVLYAFNDTTKNYPTDKLIHELFEEQVAKTPDKTAVVFENECFSYSQLNAKANQLANYLHQEKCIRPEDPVGIFMTSSINLITANLGILKVGGAFVPIEPSSPEERIKNIINDAKIEVLISQERYIKILNRLQWECEYFHTFLCMDSTNVHLEEEVEENELMDECGEDALKKLTPILHKRWNKQKHRDDLRKLSTFGSDTLHLKLSSHTLAYIIYTSGTTGRPMGVEVEHRGVVNTLLYRKEEYGMKPGYVSLQLFPYGFDGFVTSLFTPIISGAKVILLKKEDIGDLGKIRDAIVRNRVTHFISVPPLYCALIGMLTKEEISSLEVVTLAGDKVRSELLDSTIAKSDRLEIVNEYGVTECSVMSTIYRHQERNKTIKIGHPIWNTRLYILDEVRQLQPIGIAGELCISGEGLARGYLNNQQQTEERFVPVPFSRGDRVYRSGDLARWLPDRNIEFLGRIDHQVKIRGFRIEPGEIESQLLRHELISEAVVIDRAEKNGDKYLCAYIVFEERLDITQLGDYLSSSLPKYMIPTYFVNIDKIPMTSNGKVDRKALPLPEVTSGEEYAAPRNEIEKRLVEIWSEVLNVAGEVISIDSNFFELGGHSLKATTLTSKIHKALNVKLPLAEVFKRQTIRGLEKYIKEAVEDRYLAIEPVEKKEYYAFSSVQKRLYFLQQMDLESTAYNMQEVIPLLEEPNIEKFEETFIQLIERHESLRTSFHMMEDVPVQRIHEEVEFKIEYYELTISQIEVKAEVGGSNQDRDNHFAAVMRHVGGPFELSREPLLKVAIVKTNEGRYVLVVVMHHIISDGVSQGILVRDFLTLYEGEALPPLRIQYKDFSEWQNSEKQKEKLKLQEAYWLKEFEGEIPILDIPTDYPRPAIQSFEGNTINFEIPGGDTGALYAIALVEKVTLYMILLTVFNILLSKLSSQENIVIGTPVAGRRHADLEAVIGMFVNTLALRSFPKGALTSREFLQTVKKRTLEAFENQDYQFEDLVEKAPVKRDASRNPLFDVIYTLQTIDGSTEGKSEKEKAYIKHQPEVNVNEGQRINPTSKFDLSLSAAVRGEKLYFSFQYCTKLFREETIFRFIQYFKKIISSVVENPGEKISEIGILLEEEKKQILYDFNNTESEYPQNKTIHRLFEEQTAGTPDHIAIAEGNCTRMISYSQLNQQSDQLGQKLRLKGLKANDIVGIMVSQSLEMIVGILGILKAGGAYFPVDYNCPNQRLMFMLKDSGAQLVLTQTQFVDRLSSHFKVIDLEDIDLYRGEAEAIENVNLADDLAYVIYTSGSTGNPKGVIVEHRALLNLSTWHNNFYTITSFDRATKYAAFGFDASVWEIFPYLIIGASLYMIEEEIKLDIFKLNKYFEDNHITISFLPTQICEEFMKLDNKSLRVLLTGGDTLKKFTKQNYRLVNNYGPTENTVVTTSFPVDGSRSDILIGKPISNTQTYILDKYDNVLPVGVVGELCIGGDSLARGYLNDVALTEEKFGKNPFLPHPRIYRTGDLARWMPDGNIQFFGRIDHQVKIRGYRIELSEIESQLLSKDEINEAVVLPIPGNPGRNDNRYKYLCAYIAAAGELSATELREYLSKYLPDYMVPSHFEFLDNIPLTPNGKINRKALPIWENLGSEEEHISPRHLIEERLVKIWSETLNLKKVGIRDDFFELGGHSMNIIMLASRIYKEFGIELPITEIYRNRTIEEISKCIISKEYVGKPVILLNKDTQKKLFCFPPMLGYGIVYNGLASVLEEYALYAFNFIEDENRINQYVDLIKHIQASGPYKLLGWSAAGKMMFEVAKELEKQGGDVSDIILVDSFWNEKIGKKNDAKFTNAPSGNFVEQVEGQLELLGLAHLKEKVMNKVKKYTTYLHSVICLNVVNANLHLILSKEKREIDLSKGWQKFTGKDYRTYQGFGKHSEMFIPGTLEKNAEIIKKILDGIE